MHTRKFERWITGLMMGILCMTAQAELLTLPLSNMETGIKVYYASPLGAGSQSGVDEANALPLSMIQSFVRDLDHSARIVMLAGIYPLTGSLDLVADNPNQILVLDGRESAILQGSFDPLSFSGTSAGLRLRSGNIIVRGLHFQRTGFCIKADKLSTIDQVLLENITAEDVHSCILVDRDVAHPVTRWIIRNAHIKGYYRTAIRLAGAQSNNFLIDGAQIDGAGGLEKSECYKSGIQLLAGVSDIHIRNISVKNNIGSCGESYQQGDGIEADHKDGTPRNIQLDNVHVENSGDADLDLKADSVIMRKVVSLGGPHTLYAFKLWRYHQYQCEQCYAYGANAAFIQLVQASLSLKATMLSSDKPIHICDLRHGSTPAQQSRVHFEDSKVYLGNEAWIDDCGEGVLAAVGRIPVGRIAPPRPPEL